jgi:DNA-binding response OmpR family regulator
VVPARRADDVVVVVHDDPHLVPLLQHYLGGMRLLGAATLAEALPLAAEHRALALITEDAALAADAGRHLTAIACPLPSSRRIARALGAADFLVKPIAARDLLAAVDRLGSPVRRILIADSDPELVRLFRRILRSRVAAQDCLEAYRGDEALRLACAAPPDLLLVSQGLSVEGGRSLLEQIAAQPALAGVPVIITSTDSVDVLRASGTRTIQLTKPGGFQLAEVVLTLEAVFSLLASSWRRGEFRPLAPDATVPAPGATPAASRAWADTPPRPASPPVAAR